MNKYYTPETEDIRIGYICEVYNTSDERWEDREFDLDSNNADYIGNINEKTLIRTKYIDKEDIKNLGWNIVLPMSETIISFKKDNYWLALNLNLGFPLVGIILNDPSLYTHNWIANYEQENFKFIAMCKSINEFKTIMKLLNIK